MPAQFSYMVQQPDGAVSTLQSEAERAPTWGELADHVASTGAQLLPATPAQQPAVEQLSVPPPSRLPPATQFISNAPEAASAPDWQATVSPMPRATPSLTERAVTAIAPQRSFQSQVPSGAAAVLGGEAGAAAGMFGGPFAPVTIPLGATVGAALASGGTEAAQIGLERAMGWQPAEPGTFAQRVGGAAVRGGVFEALPDLVRLGLKARYLPMALVRGAGWLPSLPRAAAVAEPGWLPLVNTLQRVGSQAVGATPVWPGATTVFGPPPPGYAPPPSGG